MCDGDKALVVKDRTLSTVAKRNMQDIVPLAYDLKKAKGGLLNPDSMYNGMVMLIPRVTLVRLATILQKYGIMVKLHRKN